MAPARSGPRAGRHTGRRSFGPRRDSGTLVNGAADAGRQVQLHRIRIRVHVRGAGTYRVYVGSTTYLSRGVSVAVNVRVHR